MMKVYICPKCGWIRTVSRRNEVECFIFTETAFDRRRTYFFHRKLRKNSVVPDRVGLV